MYVAAAVAAGVLTHRAIGWASMLGWSASQWFFITAPLVVALVVALLLTWSLPSVILAVGLTEVSCLVVYILEWLKDWIMLRVVNTGRR